MKTVFIECSYSGVKDVNAIIKSVRKLLGKRKHVGLISTIQYIGLLPELRAGLESAGYEVFTGKSSGPAIKEGQILGCDVKAATSISGKVDCFVFLGDGKFHPVGVMMDTSKPVISVDVLGNAREFGHDEVKLYVARKEMNRYDAARAGTYGVLVTTKPGQERMSYAMRIRDVLRSNGRNAFVFAAEELIPENLISFPQVDAWINTACPRIPLEDAFRFRKPVVNWEDIRSEFKVKQ